MACTIKRRSKIVISTLIIPEEQSHFTADSGVGHLVQDVEHLQSSPQVQFPISIIQITQ